MPEGDTIWRTAGRLRPVLAGKTVARFEAPRLAAAGPAVGTGMRALIETTEGWLGVCFDAPVVESPAPDARYRWNELSRVSTHEAPAGARDVSLGPPWVCR